MVRKMNLQKIIFRVFLWIGGFTQILDGAFCIISLGFYSPRLTLKLSKIRTEYQLQFLKKARK